MEAMFLSIKQVHWKALFRQLISNRNLPNAFNLPDGLNGCQYQQHIRYLDDGKQLLEGC